MVDATKNLPESFQGLPIVEASEYLSEDYTVSRSIKVVNLCSHKRRLSTGYYVSLLAEARGQRALPEAKTLHRLEKNVLARDVMEELQSLIEHSFRRITGDYFVLSVYLGENLAKMHSNLARKLYTLFPAPLVRYEFRNKRRWRLSSIKHLGLSQAPADHLEFISERIESILGKPWRSTRSQSKSFAYDLAILFNPADPHPPSNEAALKQFCRAAERLAIRAEIVHPRDLPRLLEFDALFLRETTTLNGHTFRFALKAEQAGMPVVDDPESIRRCCNKVYLNELMKRANIPTPKATLLTRVNLAEMTKKFQYPIIIKIPDGSFSIGVYKAASSEELKSLCKKLFKTTSILLAQEFVPTDFDWRIGVLDGRAFFACRYFMSKGHWQIYNHKGNDDQSGDSDCIPLDNVPPVVVQTAEKASALIGNSLYGVDLKLVDDQALIIEVNDNPNIDVGVEDEILGDEIYDVVMTTFLQRLEKQREAVTNIRSSN